jgi:DnaK suppressor protein
MDTAKAKELLRLDRLRTQRLLTELAARGQEDRTAANQPGDMFDSAEPLTAEGLDDSVAAELQSRLAAIERAERRVEAGTYGRSVRSGIPIPDDRLEADPSAELTIEEAGSSESDGVALG